MNSHKFQTRALELLSKYKEEHKDGLFRFLRDEENSPNMKLTWKEKDDGWTFNFQANWFHGSDGTPHHDVHVTAQKKGERHNFSVWFEKVGTAYMTV